MSAPAGAVDDIVPGQLRWSKGAWLFRPEALDVLLRVQPTPAPDAEGFLSRDVRARLQVTARAIHRGKAPALVEPRTGIPAEISGVVLAHAGEALLVDAGVPILVLGDGRGTVVGDAVSIEVDVDAGVRCLL